MRRLLLSAVLLTVLHPLAAFAELGIAQADSSRVPIHGRVLDPMRAPIAGARVTAVPDNQGSRPSTLTDQRGEFTLAVDPGRYTITVGALGFLEASQRVTALQSGTDPREFVLQIAGVRETVTVSAPAGYRGSVISSATKTLTPLRDVPQSVTVVTEEFMKDQLMTSVGDVVRYVPGVITHQGENNRDQIIIRGNSSSADFFVNGVRDDVQDHRDAVQPRPRGSVEGTERDDVRPRRGRRCDQPGDEGSRISTSARDVIPGRYVRQQTIHRRR